MESFLLTAFHLLKGGYEVYETIESLSNKMVEILEKIGDTHYKVALALLRDVASRKSQDPEREFNQAILSLRTAYEFFVSAGDDAKILGFEDLNGKGTNYLKAFVTALLIAVCYKKYKETQLERDFLKRAKLCFSTFASAAISTARADDMNELNLISMTMILFRGDSSTTREFIKVLEQSRQDLNSIFRKAGIEEIKTPFEAMQGLSNK